MHFMQYFSLHFILFFEGSMLHPPPAEANRESRYPLLQHACVVGVPSVANSEPSGPREAGGRRRLSPLAGLCPLRAICAWEGC